MKKVVFILSAFFLLSASTICFAAAPAEAFLDDTARRISSLLKNIDSDISKAAGSFDKGGAAGTGMREAVRDLCAGKAYAIDCSFVNAKGAMEIIEPEKYRRYEGTNIKDTPAMVRFYKKKSPLFSELFTSIEKYQGIVFVYPVFSKKSGFVGSVHLLVSPELVVGEALKGSRPEKGLGINVLQPDGTNIYCSDPGQIRLNVLKSTEYKGFHELRELGKRIVSEKEGSGTYRYIQPGTEKVLKKTAFWKTVPFYDSYWRVVINTEGR